jgi:hypothetical protein
MESRQGLLLYCPPNEVAKTFLLGTERIPRGTDEARQTSNCRRNVLRCAAQDPLETVGNLVDIEVVFCIAAGGGPCLFA